MANTTVKSDESKTAPQTTTFTKWDVLEKAKLRPKEMVCEAYKEYHPADLSCHTRIIPGIDAVKGHIENDHGGGFKVELVQGEKGWDGWKKLAEAGAELHDFRCDICDAVLPLNQGFIMKHLRPHIGKIRKLRTGGSFLMTIKFDRPIQASGEEDSE